MRLLFCLSIAVQSLATFAADDLLAGLYEETLEEALELEIGGWKVLTLKASRGDVSSTDNVQQANIVV